MFSWIAKYSDHGCGSATHFLDWHTKKKIDKTCFHLAWLVTWDRCSRQYKFGETQNLCFTDYTKCRSKLLILIWILAICLCNSAATHFLGRAQLCSPLYLLTIPAADCAYFRGNLAVSAILACKLFPNLTGNDVLAWYSPASLRLLWCET